MLDGVRRILCNSSVKVSNYHRALRNDPLNINTQEALVKQGVIFYGVLVVCWSFLNGIKNLTLHGSHMTSKKSWLIYSE